MTALLPQPRIMRAVPCSCVESETPGLTEDLNWWSSDPDSLTRTLGNGLLECGFCDGDQWLWDETEERAYTLGELNTEGTRSYVRGADDGMEAERQRCLAIVRQHAVVSHVASDGGDFYRMACEAIAAQIDGDV